MSELNNYIKWNFLKAVELIQNYHGSEPLHFYLKKYFAANKKHGSRDRKAIAHFCYSFFRFGRNLVSYSIEERLKVSIFLCENSMGKYGKIFPEEWLKNHSEDLNKRIEFIQKTFPEFSLQNVFSFEDELSEMIDSREFQQSFLIQPIVFLRIRNKKEKIVFDKLQKGNIPFEIMDEDCISVPQNVSIENVLQLNGEVVVQDLSSQKIKSFLQEIREVKPSFKVWDCCAASGGKSILAKDIFQRIDLTVSDIRPQILHNLRKRFQEAGIHSYKSFVADLSKPVSLSDKFDFILCDAPCSGSGTWSRTPEMLTQFDIQQIDHYYTLQKKIVSNAVAHLKNGGYFLYITCSVFQKENENIAKFIEEKFSAKCIKSEAIKGYAHRADSMFAALFTLEK